MPQQNLTDDEFIRQMTVGTPSSDQEADPDVVKDIVRGVQYTPFDVLGAPVDIATMVMRPLGYNVEKPVGGSDYFIDQAAKLGLFKPSTDSGAELLGRIAGGGATPALARGVSKVAGATEDFISNQLKGRADRRVVQEAAAKVPPDTAYDPLRDRMEQIGALTYAIKPKGGNVVSQNIQTSLDNIRPMMAVPGEGVLPPSRMFASSYAARLKDQIEKSRQAGDPTAYLEGKLSAVEPNAALDNWIQTKLSKYVRTDMGSEADPVRKLAEEMSTKVKADYEVGLKRIAKMKSDIAKAKAKNKNTDASETTLAAEIEKVEGAFRQTSLLPAALGPYTHPALRTNRAALAAENREMAGFSPYPISKTNLGKEWEEIADMEFRPHKAGDLVKTNSLAFQENPWIGNLNPDEIVYTVDPYIYQKPMFTHTVDELKNALDPASGLPQRLQLKPEDMQQLSIDKAFRLVNNINDWRLEQRIALNLEEANRAAVTVKQYPGSPGNLQWQEIKAPTYTELPPGYTIEKLDDATSVLKGPDGKSLTYFGATDGPASNHQKEALSFLSKNDLERALKYEGSTMRHCVGGYCDDVWSGRTRTYSLRDSKGEPHVTIETAPVTRRLGIGRESDLNDSIETFLTENPKNISERLGFGINDFAYARRNSVFLSNPEARTELNRFVAAIQDNPEFKQWSQSRPVEEKILQIKGKANEKPIKKYIPFVQDFLSLQRWHSIGDLKNTDLVPLQPTLLKSAQDLGFTPNVITTAGGQSYITKEEFNRLAELFGGMNKYAAGGEVSNADFIRNRQEGSPPEGEVADDDFTQTIDEARTRHVNRALQVKINLYQHGLISLDELATYMPGIDPYNIAEMFGGTDSNPLDKAKSKDIKTLPYSPPKGIEAIDLDELARGDEGMTEEEFNPSRIPDVNRLGELGPYGDFGLPYVGRPLILKNGGDVSNEDFIQQMMTGTPPTDQEADPDVVKDIVRGAQYTPFDLLGAPVDIATMAIRPFGYNVEKPVGGSEYFIDQAAKLGLFKPSTGSAAELLGRIGGGGATPAIARGITKAADATGDFISGQLKGRADRQAVQQAAAKVPPDTAYDPLRDRMEQIGALTYAVKPKGGNVLTSKGSPVGNYIEDVITKVKGEGRDEIIPTQNRDAVEKFIAQKMPKYLAKDFGTETDPIRVALQEGRMATFGEDKQKLRKYSLAAARGGDPEAIFDVTRAYDQGTSLRPYFINPDSKAGYLDRMNVKAKGIDDLVKKIVAEGGDEDAARSALEGYSTTGFRETTLEKVIEAANKPTEKYGEGFEALAAFGGADQMEFIKKAAERGDIAYGLEPYHMLKMFNPKEVAETIGAVPSEKLSSMSFPEAFIEGTKALKTKRDFNAVIEIAKKGKGSTLPKEALLFGTKPVKVDVPSGNWIQITDPMAVDLEGRIMGHSVYRYNEPGNQYNLGGKEGFLSGRANIFSLRNEKGLPMVTVEMEDMTKIPNNPTPGPGPDFKVRQVQGKFNSLPDEYVDDVFELARNLGARWPGDFAGSQTYQADRTGKRLENSITYQWGKLYEQYKAGKKATGGEITKFIRDNT
jgi:hypothetical protein